MEESAWVYIIGKQVRSQENTHTSISQGYWIKFCTDSPKLCGRPGYSAFNHI
uniref:Uncharacterized protein n=1 Tax=Aegilops tauschii subsp. strangulata TaxID=200361 RepID=A0A453I3G8_AEGTS